MFMLSFVHLFSIHFIPFHYFTKYCISMTLFVFISQICVVLNKRSYTYMYNDHRCSLFKPTKCECRTKYPTDKTPHVHFVIGGRKPPHVFLKADKTPHAQKYNVDKTPHADFKIRTKPPSCFCSVDKQMEADRSILMQTTCIFWY